MTSTTEAVTKLLATHLGQLQHPNGATLTFLPATSPHAEQLMTLYAEAITDLLHTNGLLANQTPTNTSPPPATVTCRRCNTTLTVTKPNLDGTTWLQQLKQLDTTCPHQPLTTERLAEALKNAADQ